MNNLTLSDVNADISMLMEGFSSDNRHVPSVAHSLKISFSIPLVAVFFSMVSVLIVYFSIYSGRSSLNGLVDFILSDGWAVVVPTAIVGFFFALLTYSNLLVYFAVPEDIRNKSFILNHLKKVASRTVTAFIMLMAVATVFSVFSPWFAVGIPLNLFLLLFAVNLVVGSEINRLGAGLALEKISNLIKKI
jgi:amino acid transporter